MVARAEFTLIGICIDKLRLKHQYPDPFHPYHLALDYVLQRYCGWLNHLNRAGDVMAESRGGAEDELLKSAYEHIWIRGDMQDKADFYQRVLTSKEVKLKRKSENIAGLQLPDVLARAVRDDILVEYGHLVEHMAPFDSRLLAVVQEKYNRHLYDGRVQGYGKVLFPK